MGDTAKGALSAIFNWQNLITATLDIALFAWMHFTPEGMIFGGDVANFLGFTTPITADSGIAQVATSTGGSAYVL